MNHQISQSRRNMPRIILASCEIQETLTSEDAQDIRAVVHRALERREAELAKLCTNFGLEL